MINGAGLDDALRTDDELTSPVLLRAGIDVIGFDAWGPSMRRFESEGGKCALSAADCAANASVLVLMVVNAAQAESLLFGDAGACSSGSPTAESQMVSLGADQFKLCQKMLSSF